MGLALARPNHMHLGCMHLLHLALGPLCALMLQYNKMLYSPHTHDITITSVSATIAQTGRAALFDFPDLAHKICTKLGECHCGLYQEVSGHAH